MSEEPFANLSRRDWRDHKASQENASQNDVGASRVDESPVTILIVCTGNICRSPMAEVVLRSRLEPLGVRIHSAGTHALVDHEMTEPTQALAVEAGASSSVAAAHAARFLVEPMLIASDLVLTMSREHRSHSVKMVPGGVRRTFTAREFARLAAELSTDDARAAADAAGSDPKARLAATLRALSGQRGHISGAAASGDDDVIDPYRRSQETYEKMAAQLIPALDEVERIVRAALG